MSDVKDSIAPLVQRILSDPLHFSPATRPELQTTRPAAYVKIGSTHSREARPSPSLTKADPSSAAEMQAKAKRQPAPTSLADALGKYTGKRVLADSSTADSKRAKKQRKSAHEETNTDSSNEKPISTDPILLKDFYQINEAANDRGSNSSKRIVKNWGKQLTTLKPSGLLNHGVTCYTNAAVQAMVHIPAIQHYLYDVLANKYKDTINPRSVTHVLAETAARMWKGDHKHINPKKLIGRLDDINCMMSEWQQEDSHEYFMSLLSRLQEDSTPKGHKLNESIIYDIFGGLLNQSVTCKSCGHVSKTQQEFYDLSLHLGSSRKNSITTLSENDKKLLQQNGTQIPSTLEEEDTKQRYSIQKSIKDFFSPELIKPDRSDKSGYVCESCKQRTSAIKISSIDRFPETLPVHLKRFRFNGSSSSKVKQAVSYPSILDLSSYTTSSTPALYQLICVVVHEGRSVSSGHYIAHCRQPDGSWATYDDEYINAIQERQVLRDPSAYYLIYTRLTHKSIISNPTSYATSTPPASSLAQSNSKAVKQFVPPSPNTQQQGKKAKQQQQQQQQQKQQSTGKKVIKNAHAAMTAQMSPRSKGKQMKKMRIGSMVPTNNLGNVGGKNMRYNGKRDGKSRRFKKY
ncbi:Ubiquitin carboxyl-terminal hydrolase 10 [Cyberlindnera fabianii]|uniref:ubiquitinyl hydrolase 1 n=1 Tax=Cyberlindnera fabianii TaxID=36022 RepID=A0A1V2LE11_CYBFA|nr:Ubiquitin carboxyl-terminal hydrolase 10 [Cyberlindnera fabianii]